MKYSLPTILEILKSEFDPDVEKHLIGLYLVGSRYNFQSRQALGCMAQQPKKAIGIILEFITNVQKLNTPKQ